jgi:predicted HD phosphohydrolase
MSTSKRQTTFTAMRDGTAEDYQIIGRHSLEFFQGLPDRILDHLQILSGDTGGYAVDRLTHSLQTATRARRDGQDDEYVVCALVHDIGDTLASANHSELAATILEPFVSEENHWVVKHHGVFQGYYFFHHLGLDRNQRDRFKDHPHFRACAAFCEKYDQNSFDPEYDTQPLEAFEEAVRRVFSAPRKTIYVNEDGRGGLGRRSAEAPTAPGH